MCDFSIILILKGILTIWSQKGPGFLLNKNINFNKNETESKIENPLPTVLDRQTLCFSSYKIHELKVKLWCVQARERKKSAFFVRFILSEGSFFKIYVLSQCMVYWINFQNIYTFTYQKTLLHTFCGLVLKSSKAFSVSLKAHPISNNSIAFQYGQLYRTPSPASNRILFVILSCLTLTASLQKCLRFHHGCFLCYLSYFFIWKSITKMTPPGWTNILVSPVWNMIFKNLRQAFWADE